MIVRWGLAEVESLLRQLGSERPLLVTSERFAELDVPVASRFTGVRRHAPVESVSEAVAAAVGADGVVGVGGGSAIDTAKAVSARSELPLVAVPTTYAGAEWTSYFGSRDEARRVKTGTSGARTAAIVYEPMLTLGLPRSESVGTALNALAHCAEALYPGDCADAVEGATLIDGWLPRVVENGDDLDARTELLRGAMHAGMALAEQGLYLAHAMAQGLGGRYGLPHGAMNAICLPPALRFNASVVPNAIATLGDALESQDPVTRVLELAGLGGFVRLRDFDVPEDDLAGLAEDVVVRPAARANPRPAAASDVETLLRSVW
jgi:maleylacetate reductase